MATDLHLAAFSLVTSGSGMQPRKFQNIQDVREYLAGDSIECLVCHKHYQRLGSKHLGMHSMSVEEYKERFGIPWNRSLTSKLSREKSGAAMTPERIAAFMQIPRYTPPVGQVHRPHAPAVRAQWKKNAVAGRVLAFKPAHRPCETCGTPVLTTALTAAQPLHCDACATPEQMKQRRYMAKLKLKLNRAA